MEKRQQSRSKKRGKRIQRKKRITAAQRRARNNLGWFAHRWSDLTEEQRAAWRQRADELGRLVRKGQYYRLDGQQLFNKLNSVLALCGHEPLLEPPPLREFEPNPVHGFQIMVTGNSINLKLGLTNPPVEELMVFASPPYSAGRQYCGDYRFIGVVPPGVEHAADITRLYMKKFGAPPVNTRVFIRVWQQVNGWECRVQMRIFNVLVPAKGVAVNAWPDLRAARLRGLG